MEVLTIVATVAGILGFIYVVFVGQKSIPEWFRERRTAKNEAKSTPSISIPPRTVQHNLPHRGDFIGREKEKRQDCTDLGISLHHPIITGGKTSRNIQASVRKILFAYRR